MDVMEAITGRRSIRKFLEKEVPRELLEGIVEATHLAPSACNAQPWRFALSGRDKIQELRQEHAFKQDFVYEAPALIIICSDPTAYNQPKNQYQLDEGTLTPELERYIHHHLARPHIRSSILDMDIGIAAGYMSLAAVNLGLGSCFVRLEKTNRIARILGIPDEYNIHLTMAVGYAAENPSPRPRIPLKELMIQNGSTHY